MPRPTWASSYCKLEFMVLSKEIVIDFVVVRLGSIQQELMMQYSEYRHILESFS